MFSVVAPQIRNPVVGPKVPGSASTVQGSAQQPETMASSGAPRCGAPTSAPRSAALAGATQTRGEPQNWRTLMCG